MASGLPGVSISPTYQYFWDLGPLTFSSSIRSSICKCSKSGASAAGAPSESQLRAEIKADLESDPSMTLYKQDAKQKLANNTVLGDLPSFLNVASKIDQINWTTP